MFRPTIAVLLLSTAFLQNLQISSCGDYAYDDEGEPESHFQQMYRNRKPSDDHAISEDTGNVPFSMVKYINSFKNSKPGRHVHSRTNNLQRRTNIYDNENADDLYTLQDNEREQEERHPANQHVYVQDGLFPTDQGRPFVNADITDSEYVHLPDGREPAYRIDKKNRGYGFRQGRRNEPTFRLGRRGEPTFRLGKRRGGPEFRLGRSAEPTFRLGRSNEPTFRLGKKNDSISRKKNEPSFRLG